MGSPGVQGPIGPNATIVLVLNATNEVTCNITSPDLDVYVDVYGSNFNPGDSVHLTICENDTVLAEDITVNVCGAFYVWAIQFTQSVPATPPSGMHSLKAYVDDGDGVFDAGDVLWACWPIYVWWI